MIILKNSSQISMMRDAGKVLYEVLQSLREVIKPGITTKEIDTLAEQLIRKQHAIPSELNYEGYPASICASINDEVVHGIPSTKRVLKEGDIISIDCTVLLNGWQADSAFTMGVGQISPEAEKLIRVTEECFWKGVRKAVVGNRLGDVGSAIQRHANANGYNSVRDYTGHGIVREMHEDPAVYNFGEPGRGLRIRRGMTLAVEPMICQGDWHLLDDDDGWTVRTRDHLLCSHYEHTIAVTEDGYPEILTLPGYVWKEEE